MKVLKLFIIYFLILNIPILGEKSKFITDLQKDFLEKDKKNYSFFIQNYNFSVLLENQDNSHNRINSEIFFEFGSLKTSFLFGNYFFQPLWNRILFLRKNISNQLENKFYYRKISGIYQNFEFNSILFGLFYLKDHSKGISFGNKNFLLIWDFYKKKWSYYLEYHNSTASLIVNWEGEKKQNQGYFSFLYQSNDFRFNTSGFRSPYWDYYDYLEDQYSEQIQSYFYKSFFGNFLIQYQKIIFKILFQRKGNIDFLKNELKFKVFEFYDFSFYLGADFYKKNLTREKYVQQYGNYNASFSYEYEKFLYTFELKILKKFYNMIYKINYKKNKTLFSLGILYENFDLNKIPKYFESLDFSYLEDSNTEFYVQKEYFFDRTYVGGILQFKIYSEFASLYLNYYYSKKFLSKTYLKENQYLELGVVMEF